MVEIAGLSAGQRVLIHAGAGGVGQAAIQIARHLGAEVFATAHPNKHHVLTGLGVDPEHIASSRTLDFVDAFRDATDGQGMDVVLNSLRGEFVDASLQLLPRGGSFIEIGKTDIRAAGDIAAAHPGVNYQAIDLAGAPAESLQPAWTALTELFTAGVLTPLPTTSYGLLNAPQAFRDMSQGLHTGKIVLIPPTELDPEGTVLITGGTGMLGALFAEHLVTHYGIKHLLLVSRSGPAASGAAELHQRLTGLGAQVTITACDTANPAELAAVLDTIPAQHPLTAVIHAAGVLDDAVVSRNDRRSTRRGPGRQGRRRLASASPHRRPRPGRVRLVLLGRGHTGQPRAGQLRGRQRLPGRAGPHRHRTQPQATSVAWGYWQTPSGMTAHLNTTDLTRLTSTGLTPITNEHGLALFDAALTSQRPNLLASPFNTAALTRHARHHALPPILSALTTSRPTRPPPPPTRWPPVGHPNPRTTTRHPHRDGHHRHRHRVGPPRPGRPRSRPALQRPRHRLTDRPGTTQHPQPTHRPDPARNPDLRPPHPHRAGPPPGQSAGRRHIGRRHHAGGGAG